MQADTSAGTLEAQLKEGFLAGLSFAPLTDDRVKIFYQENEDAEWKQYTCVLSYLDEFIPSAALSILVYLWNEGFGLKVEIKQHLTGNWDAD